jgi:PmbA protein
VIYNEDRVRAIAERALAAVDAEEAEVLFLGTDSALTRFAENYIHQNVSERNGEVRVRAVVDGRPGVASTNDLSEESLRVTAGRATELARLVPRQLDWPGLTADDGALRFDAVDEATASASPEERARRVEPLCRAAAAAGASASGALSTSEDVIALLNSNGLWRYGRRSRAEWVAVVLHDDGAGYSERIAGRLADIDCGGLSEEALGKAARSRGAESVDPGVYPVILEPYAVASLVSFLAGLTFSGLAVHEGRSCLPEIAGTKAVGSGISLRDDHEHPGVLPLPFDFEGERRQRVDLLHEGVAGEALWDRRTAALAGTQSTGHALPAPNTYGPVALHLVLEAGLGDPNEWIGNIERGIWVTRFNYVRTVHPQRTVITGLTRDGTFLIENGRIAHPVRNLRFTESVLDALAAVSAVGQRGQPTSTGFGVAHVPALRIDRFAFTGSTTY